MNHTEPLPDTTVNKELEILRKALPFSHVMVYDNLMVYKVPYGNAPGTAIYVEKKIEELELNLKVENKVTKGMANDCFTVAGAYPKVVSRL